MYFYLCNLDVIGGSVRNAKKFNCFETTYNIYDFMQAILVFMFHEISRIAFVK